MDKATKKYLLYAIGACIIAFLIGSLTVIPFLQRKEGGFDGKTLLVDTLNKNTLGDEINNDEAFFTIEPPTNSGFGTNNIRVANWSYFWKLFNQHSAWQLEAWHPQLNEWVSEYNGENLNNWLTIEKTRNISNSSEKINLTVTNNAPIATRFRFTFGIDARVKQYINKTSNFEYELTYPANATEDYNVFFNWTDLKPLLQNDIIDVNHGIKNIAGKDVFWFRIIGNQNLASGNSFTIDPEFGITSTTGYSEKAGRSAYYLGSRATADVTGTATSISVYGYASASGGTIGGAIYDCDNSFSLEGYGDMSSSGMTSEGWHTIDLDTTCSISSGTTYYIIFWPNIKSFAYWGKLEGSDSMYETDSDEYNWDDPIKDDSSSTKKAVYCTVTTAPPTSWKEHLYWDFSYSGAYGTNYSNISVNPSSADLLFNTETQTNYDVNESSQTSSICALNITNDGDIPINITLKLNETIGEDIHLKYATSFDAPENVSTSGEGWTKNPPLATNTYSYTNWLLRLPSQRIINYVNGRYWVFYGNVTEAEDYDRCVISSADGITWSNPTRICNLSTSYGGADFDVVVEDNGDFHYVQSYITSDTVVQYPSYRKGNLGADGSVTWYGDETILKTWEYCEDPSINLDSDGYPYIVVENRTAGELGPVVFKSTTKNGEFTIADGYPLMLAEKSYYPGIMLPLTNNKMYCVYYYSLKDGGGGDIYGRLYNGTGWEAEVKLADNSTNNQYFIKGGAVSIDDDVHFVYFSEDNRIIHVFRNGTTGVVTETNVTSFNTDIDEISPVISKTNNGDLLCFWYLNYPETSSGYHSGGDTNTKISEYALIYLHEDIMGFKITAPGDGWIDYINAYLCYKDETADATCALYYESNDTFIAETEEKTITNVYDSFEWYRFNFTNPVYVKGGTEYIICVYGDSGAGTSKTLYVKTKSGGTSGRKVDDANDYPNFPASTSFEDVAPCMITCNYTSYNHSFVYKQWYHNNETWDNSPTYWYRDTNTTDANTIGGGIFTSNFEAQNNKILLAYVRGNHEDTDVPSSTPYSINISYLNTTGAGYNCENEITTGDTQIVTDLAVGSSQCIYLWADFDNTTYWGDIVRTINITSSNGTGYGYENGYEVENSYYEDELTFRIQEGEPPEVYYWYQEHWMDFSYSNTSNYKQPMWWDISYSNTSSYKHPFYWDMSYSNTVNYKHPMWWDMSYSNISRYSSSYWWDMSYSNSSNYHIPFWFDFSYSNEAQYHSGYYWDYSYSNTTEAYSGLWFDFEYSNASQYNQPLWWDYSYSNSEDVNWQQELFWDISYSNTSSYKQPIWWDMSYSNTASYHEELWFNFSYAYYNSSKTAYSFNYSYSNSTPASYINITNIYPANNSYDIPLQPNIYASFSQINGATMNVSWYCNGVLLGTDNNFINSSQMELCFPASDYATSYNWSINCTDGDTWVNETLIFVTEGNVKILPSSNYAVIGIVGIIGLIGFIFILVKRPKRRQKY